MNRLFLIGNGFDLAHGLKTSYNDFIVWYVTQCYLNALKNPYNDTLIEINRNNKYGIHLGFNGKLIEHWVQQSYANGFDNILYLGDSIPDQWDYNVRVFPFGTKIKSTLLTTLLEQCSAQRWVDVEGIFYEQLKEILKAENTDEKETKLKALNGSLKFLIEQLEIYLKTLTVPSYSKGYEQIFNSIIDKDNIHLTEAEILLTGFRKSARPKQMHILNFNYTNTLDLYFNKPLLVQSKSFQINYIHGKVGDKSNRLVFGFGDELDDDYLRMERENIRGYFEYIKSFWYFKTNNYRELTRFMDCDAYQVCILGHSCGLSDRTMLHMIFENTNCKSILIYYHKDKKGNSNYTDITQDISRHFKNKEDMRNKIVSEPNCSEMPQIGN